MTHDLERIVIHHLHRYNYYSLLELRRWMAECRKSQQEWDWVAEWIGFVCGESAGFDVAGIPSEKSLIEVLHSLEARKLVDASGNGWRLSPTGAALRNRYIRENCGEGDYESPKEDE